MKKGEKVEVGKVNGRYTDEFKEKVREAVLKDLDLFGAAKYCGVGDTLNSGFRQLYYKIKREENDGVDLRTIRSRHKGSNYSNVKDSGINDSSDGVKFNKDLCAGTKNFDNKDSKVEDSIAKDSEVKNSDVKDSEVKDSDVKDFDAEGSDVSDDSQVVDNSDSEPAENSSTASGVVDTAHEAQDDSVVADDKSIILNSVIKPDECQCVSKDVINNLISAYQAKLAGLDLEYRCKYHELWLIDKRKNDCLELIKSLEALKEVKNA